MTPPRGIIELATSGRREFEKPDVWIHPRRSFVVSVKAAQVSTSDQFKMGKTLRFPRFKEFKKDKDWSSALSITGFNDLKAEVDIDVEKKMDVERKKRTAKRRKKEVIILGQDEKVAEPYAGPKTSLFEGCSFCGFPFKFSGVIHKGSLLMNLSRCNDRVNDTTKENRCRNRTAHQSPWRQNLQICGRRS